MHKQSVIKLRNSLVRCYTKHKQKPTDSVVQEHLTRMRAWAIHSYGEFDELQLTSSRVPVIKRSSEMLVKVRAASLNPIDSMMIKGYAQTVGRFLRNYELPLTLGRDFSGIIIDKGQNVHNFKVGDEVYGVLPIHHQGSHSEVVIADQALTRLKPTNWTFVEAASIPYAGLTAWSAIYISGNFCSRIPKKCRVLVTGSSGGVGTLAVQMLAAAESTVIATCAENRMNFVKSLGATQVFDYRDEKFSENVAQSGPYDLILDCANIGLENISSSWQYNKFITLNSPLVKNTDQYGMLGGFAVSARDLIVANLPHFGVRWAFFAPLNAGVDFVDDLVRRKKLRAVIHGVYGFSDVPRAFQDLQKRNILGKIVIDMTI